MTSAETPTRQLADDHERVLEKLDSLHNMVTQSDLKAEAAVQLNELARFFATELELHLKKEEEALFPEFGKYIPQEGGPVGVMLMEHEDLRRLNKAFQQGVASWEQNSADAQRVINDAGNQLISLLRQHIDKEDNILFPMAEEFLSEAEQAHVGELFTQIEKNARG